MKEFIHTFSLQTKLHSSQKDEIQKAFREDFFYNSQEKILVLSKYAAHGVRIEMNYTTAEEKRYDKQHRDCKIKIIITPAKLLHPNEPMSRLYTPEEYRQACERLRDIFKEIETTSGVKLWNEVKFKRIDIAKDVKTESEQYSQEVIRMAKKALHKTGYHIWTPSAKDVEKTGWAEDNSVLYNNHNQEVEAKIYNKIADMEKRGYDIENLKGLLRFELTLKRKYLYAKGFLADEYLNFNELPILLGRILDQSAVLLHTHLVSPLWSGAMLHKDLQKKYIRIYCKSKTARRDNMMAYRKNANRHGVFEDEPTMVKHFEAAGVSPLYLNGDIRNIPSFADLLAGTRNERVERFLQLHS